MDENKIETKAHSEPDKPRKELTEAERQKRKKLFIYPLMVAMFVGAMWLIFAPSDEDKAKEQEQAGYNTEVPSPTNKQMVGDKQAAYEQDLMDRKQEERRSQMQDLASMFGSDDEYEEDYSEPYTEPQRSYGSGGGSSRPRETIYASANAYQDINRTLGNFYETPKEDPENSKEREQSSHRLGLPNDAEFMQKEEMRLKLEELNARLEQAESPRNAMDEQLALMEKSYELAAKYLPSGQSGATPPTQPTVSITETAKPVEAYKNGKAQMTPIGQVQQRIVSGLTQPVSDSEFIADYSQERNMGFHTAVGTEGKSEKNTIKACIHDNQTITDGQAVRMRLLEPMRAGETIVPRNALVTGMAKIQGERLGISITSLEYEGLIIPVTLTVIDSDGQELRS
ncbi:Conjugative transposon protein TraM [Mucinivorans hirudinis]|uniref:Conjugative transposon protein TraM n=1 Tax=Mucinivorans hirudinis TaxID=1433126 RepID=A0A060RA24_9BACT|nr:Conjugative transposon protein TraM [Mucinivorans hirudinis]